MVLWYSSQEIDTMMKVQILDVAVCISHNADPGILSPVMGK